MNLWLLFPEGILTGILVLLVLAELAVTNGVLSALEQKEKIVGRSAVIGTVLVFLALLPFAGKIDTAFNGMFILDPVASFFKVFFALTALVIIQMSREYFRGPEHKHSDFFLILWTTLIGLFFLVSANDFLLLFIALEIVTLSFYVMAAYSKHDIFSIESGLKYLILGSLASAFLIYGISLLYIGTGSTALPAIADAFHANSHNALLLTGILMVLAGVGFKVASVPFQFWVPDVYEGAPSPVVAFLSVGSKAAGFAVLMRLLFTVFTPFDHSRLVLFTALAAMTLLYGNLGALVQTNIKRLFGYSSIGHAGYLLIGIAVGHIAGTTAVFYYLIAYALSTLTGFMVITLAGKQLGSDQIHAYRGLAKRSPFLAGMLFLSLVSLAGVPPLAGFFGKFLILLAAVQNHGQGLALLGALGVAVSLYYYLSVVKTMYVDEPLEETKLEVALSSKILLVVLAAGILIVGIWQAPFYQFAHHAAQFLF